MGRRRHGHRRDVHAHVHFVGHPPVRGAVGLHAGPEEELRRRALRLEDDGREAPRPAREDPVSRSRQLNALSREPRQMLTIEKEEAMRIKWTKVYVDDQEKALQFYTEKLGFEKKADFSQGDYRWLTVASPEDPEGVELLLESNADPAGRAYQEAVYGKGQPAAQFLVDDVQAEHDRLAAAGVKFTMPVTSVTGSIIAVLDDTCGNLIQLTHLTWG